MRRVAVTGLGHRFVHRQQHTGSGCFVARGELRHHRCRDLSRMGFRSQVEGSLKIDLDAMIDRRARRFMGDGAAYFLAMEQAMRDSGLEEKDIVNERTGLIMGSGGPSTRAIVAAADTAREPVKGAEARRPLRGAQGDVVHLLGGAFHLVQDQGPVLFHQFGLRDQRALHRQCRRADPMGQAGHHVRGRRRRTRLDAFGPVRRHGRDVFAFQRHAGEAAALTTRTATAS